MIAITSNVDKIIAELEAARAHLETKLMPAVMQPALYLDDLIQSAESVLSAYLDQPGEREAIPKLLATIRSAMLSDGMAFEMLAIDGEDGLSQLQPGDVGYQRISALRSEVEEWVRLYKTKKAEDYDLTDEALAARVMALFARDPQAWTQHLNDFSAGIRSKPGLLEYLHSANPDEFNAVFGLVAGVSPLRAAEALELVLARWQAVIGVAVVREGMNQINRAFAV